jgi:hypothetical protein
LWRLSHSRSSRQKGCSPEACQIQLKALEILKEQSQTGNLKRACLENALGKIIAPLLHRDLGG